MFKDFFKDALKYVPAQVVPAIVGFFSIPILTRLFSPQEYGDYSVTMTTVMFLITFTGWLPMGIFRYYAAYERDDQLDIFYGSIINLSFLSIIIVTVASLIILFSIKSLISPRLFSLNLIGLGVMIAISLHDTFLSLLRVGRKAGLYSFFSSWRSIGGIGLALFCIFYFDKNIDFLLWGTTISILICLPLTWKKAVGVISLFNFRINFSLATQLIRYSFPLVLGNLAAWVLSLSDRYLLQIFRGAHEVGIYSAVYTISEKSILFLVQIISLASGPIAMDIWEKEGEDKSKKFRTEIVRYFLLISVPAVIGLCALSHPIISVLTGEKYIEGYKILPFIVAGAFLFGLQGNYQIGFLYRQKTGYITIIIIITACLKLILSLLLIPRWGYMAAATTTLISYAFLLLLMILISRRIFAWKFPFDSFCKIIFSSVIMGIAVVFVFNNLGYSRLINLSVSIFGGTLLYIILIYLLKEIKLKII